MESEIRFLGFFFFLLQEGEKLVKKIGGVFAFKVKDGPGGKEATWTVDVKNGQGSVSTDSGQCFYVSMHLLLLLKVVVFDLGGF